MALEVPVVASQKEVPKDKKWELGAVFELEADRIRTWIRGKANEGLSRSGATVDSVLDNRKVIVAEIRANFGTTPIAEDKQLLVSASQGEIEENAPSTLRIRAFAVIKWILMLTEIFIFVWTAILGMTNYFVILVGVLLAFAGWLLGFGIGRIATAKDSRETTIGVISSIVGVLGIGALSYIRSDGISAEGSLSVVIITALLAFMIAMFKALELISRDILEQALRKIFLCQRWIAARRHREACDNGLWDGLFQTEVKGLADASIKVGTGTAPDGSAASGSPESPEEVSLQDKERLQHQSPN